jgi:Spy/CpxP family protein refolding chaperone
MREQMRGKMAEVLTPDQLAKMEAMREQNREHRKEKRGHGKGRHCGEDKVEKTS